MVAQTPFDIVIPSVRAPSMVERVVSALQRACDRAGVPRSAITLVDDLPGRPEIAALADRLDVRRRETNCRGPGAARNAGSGGNAPWLLFVDDDVEVDEDTVAAAREAAQRSDRDRGPVAYLGGLRPPPGVAQWLHWAYSDETMFSATWSGASGPLPAWRLCGALLLLRRREFEGAGGFPELRTWEDAILGLRVARFWGSDPVVARELTMSGVHWNVPASWSTWLVRQQAAGVRLAEVASEVPDDEFASLAAAMHLHGGSSLRTRAKQLAASVPPPVWRYAVGRWPRRLAASAAFTRAFREAAAAAGVTP